MPTLESDALPDDSTTWLVSLDVKAGTSDKGSILGFRPPPITHVPCALKETVSLSLSEAEVTGVEVLAEKIACYSCVKRRLVFVSGFAEQTIPLQ